MSKVANFIGMSNDKTAKVNKRFERGGTIRYSLYKETTESMNEKEDMKKIVKCPPDEDINDFLANHVVDFYTRAKLVYSTVMDTDDALMRTCNGQNCPAMNGGPKYEYLWQDGNRKPEKLSAPEYVIRLMEWIDDLITDEKIFPPVDDVPFPSNFKDVCKKIFRRLYRVFVHVYIEHFERCFHSRNIFLSQYFHVSPCDVIHLFDRLQEAGAEAHTNTFYRHYYFFMKEHKLMEDKDFAPLETLNEKLCKG